MNELQASSVPLVDKCSSHAVIVPATKSPNKVSDSAATTAPNAVLYTSGNMSLTTLSTGSSIPIANPNPKQEPAPLLSQLKLTNDLKQNTHGADSEGIQNSSFEISASASSSQLDVNRRRSEYVSAYAEMEQQRSRSLVQTKLTKNGCCVSALQKRPKSQNNLCNGGLGNSNHALAPKVANNSGSSANGQKKGTIALSHLPQRPPVDIEFCDISYSVADGHRRGFKTILKSVSGKTAQLSGSVLINSKERNLRRFRKLSCYIMQDDVLIGNLTVREAMMVAANLKLGKNMISYAKVEILETIGLKESVNTLTCNLSGGQRKRLSIALELVNNPPVMFFDEPTSGLDSSTCFQLISLLRSLARGGRTIPSARLFEKFDHLYLLAQGQCVYEGRVKGLVSYLSSLGYECPSYHNPADYVLEVASGEYGDAVPKLVQAVKSGACKKYAQKDYDEKPPLERSSAEDPAELKPPKLESQQSQNSDCSVVNMPTTGVDDSCSFSSSKGTQNAVGSGSGGPSAVVGCMTSLLDSHESVTGFPTSGWTQFWILLQRSFRTILRDKMLTHMRLFSHIIVGAIIGMIYYDVGNEASKIMSNAGCIFFVSLFTTFTAMMPTILTFPTEMSVFVREHLNYWYSLKAFYFAKTIADLPFQPMELERVSMFVLICVLNSLVAQSLGLLIGAGMNIETGVFLGPVTTIPTILFSGFFVTFDTIPGYLQWVTYVSYVRYGFEGAMVAIYGMDRAKMECNQIYCHYRVPKKFLEQMSMENALFWVDAVALIGIFFALRIVAYFVLRWKLHMIR
ncbi:hypothetical protein M5D96_011853 [Drosophila gunungcola]|uniref:ABC transporter domain-containing protein n=1 Tax=Drosophila gunungcola TaxID=103775 RepID=A0A9P9YEF2_9MUSC|nr:hypothetical protein M5D96_011853 [Drosophila gunungcola]